MSDFFGILDNGREQWCRGFAWDDQQVICELEYSLNGGADLQGGYFLLDTGSGKAQILSSDSVEEEWKLKTGAEFPVLKTRYESTSAK